MTTKVIRDTKYLFPPLAKAAAHVIELLQPNHPGIAIFETWRHPLRQHELFQQGRSKPGAIVTKSLAWESWHQYGLAFDVAVKMPDGDWSWDFDKEGVREAFLDHGLEIGPRYEYAHFQVTFGLTITEARKITLEAGILAVWYEVARRIQASGKTF